MLRRIYPLCLSACSLNQNKQAGWGQLRAFFSPLRDDCHFHFGLGKVWIIIIKLHFIVHRPQ